MQIQQTIQTVETSHLLVQVPASFVHRQVEIIVLTLDETEFQPIQKRRTPPQFAGQVRKRGDVMSSVSVEQRR